MAGFNAEIGARVKAWVEKGLAMGKERKEAWFKGQRVLTKEQRKRGTQPADDAMDPGEVEKGRKGRRGGGKKKSRSKGKGKAKATEENVDEDEEIGLSPSVS